MTSIYNLLKFSSTFIFSSYRYEEDKATEILSYESQPDGLWPTILLENAYQKNQNETAPFLEFPWRNSELNFEDDDDDEE